MRRRSDTAMDFPKSLLRPALQLAREARARSDLMLHSPWRGPLAVFLPAYGRTGAALLRVHNVARALRPLGWRTLVMPVALTLPQRRRILAQTRPDVLVMQGARHALNRPDFYPEFPIVYDMDDADFHLAHLADPVAAAMGRVSVVTAGSAYIANWCRGQGADARVIWTGMPVSRRSRPPQTGRPPVVAWAQTRPMTYRREAAFVLEVMSRLAARCPEVRLRLYDRQPGDDPGFADRFRAAGIRTEWRPAMPLGDYLASFDDVALGLAPLCPETPFSRGKSFGKVLGYCDRHVPVIASDAGEHGRLFAPDSGIVSSDPAVWVESALGLLSAAERRQAMAEAAFSLFRSRLSSDAVAQRVSRVLDGVLSRRLQAHPSIPQPRPVAELDRLRFSR